MAVSVTGCAKNDKEHTSVSAAAEVSDAKEAVKEIDYNVDDYVKLGEYKGLEVSVDGKYDVTEDQVKEAVDQQCSNYPEYEEVQKDSVESGDTVDIDYEGTKDGVAFDGGTAKGAKLEIGSKTFIDGFEDGLIGAKVGEERELNLTFPKEYQNKDLAGQAVVFKVKVNKIVTKKDMSFDTLTDEYVSANFKVDSVDAYVKSVEDNLKAQAEKNKESATKTAIIDKIVAGCKVDKFPDGLLEQRVKKYIDQFQKMCDSYGVKMKDYLKSTYNMSQKDFESQVESYMTQNIKTELVFEAIAKKENLEIDKKGYDEYVKKCMAQYGYTDEKAMYEAYGEKYLKNVYLYEKALEQIKKDTKVDYTNKEKEDANSK